MGEVRGCTIPSLILMIALFKSVDDRYSFSCLILVARKGDRRKDFNDLNNRILQLC